MLALAGQKADGYLARPAESIPSLREDARRDAGLGRGRRARPEPTVEVAGYLLTLVDETRREALNRAKREPFVIYMMAVQSDVSLNRAGFDPELRDRIAAAWRAEDYHAAAQLIPDELLDAFMLCGTARGGRGPRRWRTAQAGMDLPVLQPVRPGGGPGRSGAGRGGRVRVRGAAGAAGPGRRRRRVGGGRVDGGHTATQLDRQHLSMFARARRHARRAGTRSSRPFSFTASTVPVAAAGGLAALEGLFDWPLFLGALLGAVLLHVGTNIVNEIYDVRKGVDTITSPRASHAILKGRMTEREAFGLAVAAFALAAALGVWLIVGARLAGGRARARRPARRLGLHGAAARVQVPRRSACRWCSC